MRRTWVLCCAAAIFVAGCGAYRGKPKTSYWVEAYQNGRQIGIWKTAPGSIPYDDFGTIRFTAENGENVILQGQGLTIRSQEVKESIAGPYRPTGQPAPKLAPKPKPKPKAPAASPSKRK